MVHLDEHKILSDRQHAFQKVTGRIGLVPVWTPCRFGPVPIWSDSFGAILGVGRFGHFAELFQPTLYYTVFK